MKVTGGALRRRLLVIGNGIWLADPAVSVTSGLSAPLVMAEIAVW